MNQKLSSDHLGLYIEEVELPSRSVQWPEAEAKLILRCGAFVGSVLQHYSALHRTMLHARSFITRVEEMGHSVASGTTIIADSLTGSKGRFARNWHAPEGGLWGTLIYVNTLLPQSRLLLPLAAGVACCEAIRECCTTDAAIRWVNDVLIGGRKVAGFLSESLTGALSNEEYCLIGFGINVNNHSFPEELQKTATSVGLHLGRPVDMETFSYCFLAKLTWNMGLLHYHEALSLQEDPRIIGEVSHPLIARYRELCDSERQRVVFGFDVMKNPQFRATVRAIGQDGGLQLMLDDGTEITEYSGEIRYVDRTFWT